MFHPVTLWFGFNGLLLVRTELDELLFHELSNKLNTFRKDYMLSKICGSDQ